jgi:mitochondrial Rho GTPase 1
LLPHEFFIIKKVVKENLSEGVNERGLTLPGFLCLHALFFEKGTPEKTWTMLRNFGYTDDIKLADDFILHFIRAPDQVFLLR